MGRPEGDRTEQLMRSACVHASFIIVGTGMTNYVSSSSSPVVGTDLPMVSHILDRAEHFSTDVATGEIDGKSRFLRLNAAEAAAAAAAEASASVRPLVDQQVVVLREGPLTEATRQRRHRRRRRGRRHGRRGGGDDGDDEGGGGLRAALPPRGRIPRCRLELLCGGWVHRKHLDLPSFLARRALVPLFAAAPSKSISGGKRESVRPPGAKEENEISPRPSGVRPAAAAAAVIYLAR